MTLIASVDWLHLFTDYLWLWVLGFGLLALIVLLLMLRSLRKHQDREADAGGASSPAHMVAPAGGATTMGSAPGDLTLSFMRAVRHLRAQTTGRRRLYRVPWFLLLGEAGGGKTALLQSLSAAGASSLDAPELRHGLGWSFFDHGVVLDVPGDYIWQPATGESNERGWRALMRLLNRTRPRRPLDGVVLTLPVRDFLASSELNGADLVAKARRIADKLAHLQRETGVCFPVYVLISQCDEIPGFSSYAAALPPRRLREIFGWSSPYRVDTNFESSWVDEALEEIVTSLNRTQSELFVERMEAAVDPAALYFFPAEMLALRERMRTFLHQVFRSTAYRASFTCRGIYFCGDGPEVAEAAASPVVVAETLAAPRLHSALLGLPLGSSARPPRPVFLDELFERKVFPEWGLAFPENRAISFRRGALLTSESLTLVAAMVLAFGLVVGFLRLNRLAHRVLPVLQAIQSDVSDARTQDSGNVELQHRAYDLVRSIGDLGSDRFFYIFYPASWSRSLDRQIQDAVETAFEQSVLQATRAELVGKAQTVATGLSPTAPSAPAPAVAATGADGDNAADATDTDAPMPAPGANVSIDQLPEYASLQQFTGRVETLEDNIARYQRIIVPGSPGAVADLNALMKYLHPGSTYVIPDNQESYLAAALDAAKGQPFPQSVLDQTRSRVHDMMRTRVDALYEAWFFRNPSVDQLQNLADQIDALGAGHSLSYDDLQNLQAALNQAEVLVSSPQSAWMADPTALFQGPLRRVTLDPIEHSASLQAGLFFSASDLENYIRSGATADWQTAHGELAALHTGLTGPLLAFGPESVRLSAGVESLRLPLTNLMNLSFMADTPAAAYRASIPPDSSLSWNTGPLQSATGMVSDYQRYVREGLLQAPVSVRDAFRRVALAHLRDNLSDELAQAEVWAPAPSNSEDLQAAVSSFQTAAPLLTQLLQDYGQLDQAADRGRLLALLNQQGYLLLRDLDAELSADAPYQTGPNLSAWMGTRPAALAAFAARSTDELNSYLDFQRQRMLTLAANATPLVTFLGKNKAPGRSAGEVELLARWQGIVSAVKHFQDKLPGNSLSDLEQFIATDLDKISPASQCRPAPPASLSGGDFFQRAKLQLWRSVDQRCRAIDVNTAESSYDRLAAVFNRTLAGRFPFTATASADGSEADPAAIASFYRQLDRVQAGLNGQLPATAAAFVSQINGLRPLWATLLSPAAVPVFDVTPTFRVNRSHEQGGNQIISWGMTIGTQSFQPGQSATGQWVLGEPVTVTLHWASDSPRVPLAPKNAPPTMRVQGRTVTYTYRDPWALLSLIRNHVAAPTDFDTLHDTTPNTLVFNIPTVPAGATGTAAPLPTKVFIRVAVKTPGKVESLPITGFPSRAPTWGVTSHAADDSH